MRHRDLARRNFIGLFPPLPPTPHQSVSGPESCASIKRRAWHTITQVFWTQGDNGHPMLNYADLVGFAADDAISNLYVPGQQTSLSASAERYGIALATAPIDNVVTEFLPDLARRIHIRVVLVQRIINQVARTDNNGQ